MYLYSWWLIRVPVLLVIPFFFYDLEVLFLLSAFLVVHFSLGLSGILNDYLHNKTLKVFLITLIRLLNFEFLRYTLEYMI